MALKFLNVQFQMAKPHIHMHFRSYSHENQNVLGGNVTFTPYKPTWPLSN